MIDYVINEEMSRKIKRRIGWTHLPLEIVLRRKKKRGKGRDRSMKKRKK